jgi:hypothetical protein
MVADLEDQAMGDCTELMTKLDAILAAVECICPNLLEMRAGTTLQPDSLNTDEITDVFEWSDNVPNPDVPSQEEAAACAISQLWYQAGFEVITEAVLPASRAAFRVLLALVAAKVATMTGGLTLPQVLGAVKVSDLVADLIEGGFDASESNIYNWMVTNKQDIICALYEQVLAGGTATSCWTACYDSVIAPSSEISALDKAMLWLFMGHVAYVIAYLAYTESTDWATSVIVSDYCLVCDATGYEYWAFPPCPGDWDLDGTTEACSSGGRPVYSASDTYNHEGTSPEFVCEPGTQDHHLSYNFGSHKANGWTVGYMDLQEYNTTEEVWQSVPSSNITLTRTVEPLALQTTEYTRELTTTYPLLRVRLQDQDGQFIGTGNPGTSHYSMWVEWELPTE